MKKRQHTHDSSTKSGPEPLGWLRRPHPGLQWVGGVGGQGPWSKYIKPHQTENSAPLILRIYVLNRGLSSCWNLLLTSGTLAG